MNLIHCNLVVKSMIRKIIFVFLISLSCVGCQKKGVVYYYGGSDNEIYELLNNEGFSVKSYENPEDAVIAAEEGAIVMLLSEGYPNTPLKITSDIWEQVEKKKLQLYAEFVNDFPGINIASKVFRSKLERGVVVDSCLLPDLKPMELLGVNDCYIYKADVEHPLLVLAKVAGYDKADYGISDVEAYPMLVRKGSSLLAFTKLSNFKKGRYEPLNAWQGLWRYIFSFLTNNPDFKFSTEWPTNVKPMYGKDEPLKENAKREMVEKGIEWFFKGRFLVDASWKELQLKYEGDGLMPVGIALSDTIKMGDGHYGILEGHASNIYYDGNQDYRYWLRNDVQGEVSFALAAGGALLNNDMYRQVAKNLLDYVFISSPFRKGEKNNPSSPVYGLLGWSETHDYVFYADDNARSVLAMIAATSFLKPYDKWNKEIVECILANFRLANVNGFFAPGGRLEEPQIMEKGWEYFSERPDFINPHPHFESWMWACYLWLYDKTGYEPLLKKAKKAIQITMEAYPEKWGWTNGIQQERARMILPLAWLVRVEDTPEHRAWLDVMVQEILKNQVDCGAVREELGSSNGTFGGPKSNKDYGITEAPLISVNGDPVADMLYTSNFAFFALNEAASATNNEQYRAAVDKMSDFLTRIQVCSENINHVDGAWFRAFDYNRWDYWASNADHGWGAWSTLTGWIQSWIVGTQVLKEKETSYWEVTKDFEVDSYFDELLPIMLKESNNNENH